jgi:hypothetical protein
VLQREIKIAKDRSWKELIESVESDPWGRPYKVVLSKLTPPPPPQTESMDPETLDEVVGTGPDGIPGRIWAETIDLMAPRLRHLFNGCMREGAYRRRWRVARLVLLREEGRPPDSPSGCTPICLLDEMGKLLERMIAARLEAHMRQRERGWHDRLYGFRQGRSTIDAVKHARRSAQEMVTRQGVALAVSLDITNAFNTIPWDRIIKVLRHYRVPKYLVEVIKTYLSDTWVEFSSKRGMERRPVERGVPQGSVLGPTLWFTAYDRVLRCPRPLGTDLACHTDDTLILTGGRWWHETANLAEACVKREIRRLGLRVSPAKSEVLGFYNSRHRRSHHQGWP